MDTRIHALILDLQAAALGISKRKLAARAGLHLNTLRAFRDGCVVADGAHDRTARAGSAFLRAFRDRRTAAFG